MPKKSKKSRYTDPDLPDLETRRANLLAIGMPSPYQGDTTSSSSFDDSSSSTTANEAGDSSSNTGRLEEPADGSRAIAYHSHELPDLTTTSSNTEPQRDQQEWLGIICQQTSSVLVIATQSGYTSEAMSTSTTNVSSVQSYQNLPKDHESYSEPKVSAKKTAEKAGLSELLTLERKPRTIAPANLIPEASSKENITAQTECMTEVSAKERAKSIKQPKKDVASKERSRNKTLTKQVSSKERSKNLTPTKAHSLKERSKSITPSKKEVSLKEKSKRMTPTKTEVSSKERSKSITPTKRQIKISSTEKSKCVKTTNDRIEVTPGNVFLEASREKYDRNLLQDKYSLKVTLDETMKNAISTKPTLEKSSRKKWEKIETSAQDRTESPPKEKTKRIPQVLPKKLTFVTPDKCSPSVSSKERTLKPAEHKPDASSQVKCEKTYTLETPSKEKKTVTPVKHTSKERLKIVTPTKRMPEASSNENRARVTPSKRKPQVSPKGETKSETKLKQTSVALSEKKIKVTTQAKRILEKSTASEELKLNTRAENATMTSSQEKTKSVASRMEQTSCFEKAVKPGTSTKCTSEYTKESPVKHATERVLQDSDVEYKTHEKFTEPDVHDLSEDCNERKDSDTTDKNIISFKDFKETLGVDRVPTPDINFEVFDKAVGIYKDSEKSSPNKSIEPQQHTPVVSTEHFLEAINIAIINLKLSLIAIDNSTNETRIEPTSADPRVSDLTIEEFRNALGTDRVIPIRTDNDLDVFDKALEKLEEKRRRDVRFLVPKEPVPSTSRVRTSPERQLKNKLSQNTKPETKTNRNQTVSGGTLTYEEFHRGLSTQGYLNPDLITLDVFEKALKEAERISSSQPAQEVHKYSCRPNPPEERNKSDSSDEDINKAIVDSGIKIKRFRVISSDDESKNSSQSDSSNLSNQSIERIEKSKLHAPRITSQIPEEDCNLSESTSKSSEAVLEESMDKSYESDLYSPESVVKSSESSPMEYIENSSEEEAESAVKSTESEVSPMEYIKQSSEEKAESSGSAVKSTESETSPEEHVGVFKESTELHDSKRTSSSEKRLCETRRGEFSGSLKNTKLKSPKKRRRSERILNRMEKSTEKQQRSRAQSENDLRKRRPTYEDLKPKKKRYSDEH